MGFTVLLSDDASTVRYRSSISQHKNKLSVMQRGEWIPISYDVLDWINCEDGVKSHRAVVTDGDDIGFNFDVGTERTLSDIYVSHNYGVDEHGFAICAFVQDDNGTFGECEDKYLRIGLNYALADDTIKPEDAPSMSVLEPQEQIDVKYHSSISQHKNKLSVMQRGEWVPISFDALDWINCEDGIKSHRAIVTDGDDIGFDFSVGTEHVLSEVYALHNAHIDEYGFATCAIIGDNSGTLGECNDKCLRIGLNYALANNTLTSDSPTPMPVLEPDEQPEVFYHSSISQHKNKLSVMQRGEWIPISFDVLDWINCETGIKSHRAVVTDGDDIGFDFPVGSETLLSDTYLTGDYEGVVTKELPAWFGTGEYQEYVLARDYVNSDCDSLGHRTAQTYRIGLNYALATKTLEADD